MPPKRVAETLTGRLQSKLDARASRETKGWIEKYMKNVIEARGLQTPDVVSMVAEWRREEGVDELAPKTQKMIATLLMKSDYTEDKLASSLVFQTCLIPSGSIAWRDSLPWFASFFDDGLIWDWASCDGFCGRVLKHLVMSQKERAEREACARGISEWRNAENLWRQRASCVSFVTLAKQGDAFFPGFKDMLLDGCGTTVRRQERFVQTGTGWLLREIGKGDESALVEFCEWNLEWFTGEGLRYAVEKLPREQSSKLRDRHKERRARQGANTGGEREPQKRKRKPEDR
eukprot:evm.model.scf_362EXC.11 EVM.evm.TU.scf_362EXC.11   scf_362EXC:64437-65566(+)